MRPQAAMRGGFYPAPPEAIAAALSRLAPSTQPTAILDPCCGKGRAILQIHEALGGQLYAIELEDDRAVEAKNHLTPAGGQVLGPADFLSCTVTAGSFGFVWCNPPFDDEVGGGGRVEYSFLTRATQLLCPKGIMALVCPEKTARQKEVAAHMFSHYEALGVLPFPDGHRAYSEVVVFGVKRARPVESEAGKHAVMQGDRIPQGFYKVPPAGGPKRFLKSKHTQTELLALMGASPLRRLLAPASPLQMPRPPLELSKGQLALVLAAGYLNTTLQKPGQPPILIKATAFKEDYLKSSETELRGAGTDKEEEVQVNVTGQRIKMRIRVAEQSGAIHEVQ